MPWDKDGTKFEGNPTELLFGAEAAPDADMAEETGETCEWCEHDTAVVTDVVWNNRDLDDCESANYQIMKCSTCGAEYHTGTKFVSFTTYVKQGKPELSVDS